MGGIGGGRLGLVSLLGGKEGEGLAKCSGLRLTPFLIRVTYIWSSRYVQRKDM